ncbi:hypothetical protein D3C76_1284140 [compost metagenome]
MGRSRIQIEFSGLGSVCTFEDYIFRALTYIKTFFEIHFIFCAIYNHGAFTTDIDDAQFTAFQEISNPKFFKVSS